MKGLFIPGITAEMFRITAKMFRNSCLESIETLMAKGIMYDIDYTGWIPVGERLPEKSGHYIVTEKVFRLDDRAHKGRYNTRVEQVEYSNGKWQMASFFEVTAWMPLPEPYKEESEVEDDESVCK